jgi:hypothetical protein
VWSDSDSDSGGGVHTYCFLKDGVLEYTFRGETFRNGAWQQTGSSVSFSINNHYSEHAGTITGNTMVGGAHNRSGKQWTWTLTLMGTLQPNAPPIVNSALDASPVAAPPTVAAAQKQGPGEQLVAIPAPGVPDPTNGRAMGDAFQRETTSRTEAPARRHEMTAKQLFDARRFTEAASEFERAFSASNDPAFLYNKALCYRRADNAKLALEAYEAYLRAAPNSPQRPAAEARIQELRLELPSQMDKQAKNAKKTINVIYVESLKNSVPIPFQPIWLAYYVPENPGITKWVISRGTTADNGKVAFNVRSGASGESMVFTIGLTEESMKQSMAALQRSGKPGLRMPPDVTRDALTIRIDRSNMISNIDGPIQLWSIPHSNGDVVAPRQ